MGREERAVMGGSVYAAITDEILKLSCRDGGMFLFLLVMRKICSDDCFVELIVARLDRWRVMLKARLVAVVAGMQVLGTSYRRLISPGSDCCGKIDKHTPFHVEEKKRIKGIKLRMMMTTKGAFSTSKNDMNYQRVDTNKIKTRFQSHAPQGFCRVAILVPTPETSIFQ